MDTASGRGASGSRVLPRSASRAACSRSRFFLLNCARILKSGDAEEGGSGVSYEPVSV